MVSLLLLIGKGYNQARDALLFERKGRDIDELHSKRIEVESTSG